MVFVLLLAVFAVMLIGVFVAGNREDSVPSSPAPVRSSEAMRTEWLSGVARVLADYDRNHDAQAAENALLAMTVPTQDARHLDLVRAFHALATNANNAEAELATARAAFASATSTP